MTLKYVLRLLFRTIVFCATVLVYIFDRSRFEIFFNDFFGSVTVLHFVWAVIMAEMLVQVLPLRSMPTGCMKQFTFKYIPVTEGLTTKSLPATETERLLQEELLAYRRKQNMRAFITCIIWFGVNSLWWILRGLHIVSPSICLIGTTLYCVFDIICILFFCPFQLFLMKGKCCATCRIFNYGQIFLCTPLMGIGGFGAVSLCTVSIIIFLRWEYCFWQHTERFFEKTNRSLQCGSCNDRLCKTRQKTYHLLGIYRREDSFRWNPRKMFRRK